MDNMLSDVLENIGKDYSCMILKGSRHYLEVNIGERAEQLGHHELKEKYRKTFARPSCRACEN